ncbi:MAG: mannose-1-phosphate guanylyltransferase [Clostridia bacterium]|nr:mannose-1-phosphate guanylyltransferase [Clostridia bacterium]
MDKYAVIMAGGGGTRFWPLSRQQKPKQLLNISGNDVMINEAIKRMLGVVELDKTYIVTNKKQKEVIRQLIMNELPKENILYEPIGRNTAACIAYAAVAISAKGGDALMCVLPSDHFIGNEDRFRETMARAFDAAEKTGKLITVGIKPTFPSTGYGYIRYTGDGEMELDGVYEVDEFIEKPGIESARRYVESGNYLWNSGMFVWKVSTILENIKRYLPRLYKSMLHIREMILSGREQEGIESIYSALPSISIDFGIMERSDEVLVIPGDFGWNDVGSWDALGTIFPTDESGNIIRAKHVSINTKNSIIYNNGDRLIATIGLDNLIIADTSDALLICPKDKAQEVKNIVELIKAKGLEDCI